MSDSSLPEEMQLFNAQQVAKRLGVSSRSVLRWIKSGRLEGQKLGPRQYRVSRAQLDKFLNRARKETLEALRNGAE